MIRASVSTLTVDDHAARQRDPPAEAALGQPSEQHRRAEIVVGDIAGHVTDVQPQADHGCLVADRVDSVHGFTDDIGVADVAVQPLRPGRQLGFSVTVRGRVQPVDDPDLPSLSKKGRGDMRADEPSAAGDQDGPRHRVA